MEGKRLIQSLELFELLSFVHQDIELQPLNVLIGPNASGKSNFIEAIRLLSAAPRELTAPFLQGGGVSEWLCKYTAAPEATIKATVEYPRSGGALHYSLSFTAVRERLHVTTEGVTLRDSSGREEGVYSRGKGGVSTVRPRTQVELETSALAIAERAWRELDASEVGPSESVLSRLQDLHSYPELRYLTDHFRDIRVYSYWDLSPRGVLKRPQPGDLSTSWLEEDASNLALVVASLNEKLGYKLLVEGNGLQKLDPGVAEVYATPALATVEVSVREADLSSPTPAVRLSDGALRYLCLLTILLHPDPPPLVCIQEPEIGLHPDILPTVADLLKDASQRMQLIVTTHSDIIVSALSDVPEAIIVCERGIKGTEMRRLDTRGLEEWLEDYRLGEVWLRGEIGGTRF